MVCALDSSAGRDDVGDHQPRGRRRARSRSRRARATSTARRWPASSRGCAPTTSSGATSSTTTCSGARRRPSTSSTGTRTRCAWRPACTGTSCTWRSKNSMMKKGEMEVLDAGRPAQGRRRHLRRRRHHRPHRPVAQRRAARLLGGDVRFVLSTSGHIQALVNPPGPGERARATAPRRRLPDDPNAFLRDARSTAAAGGRTTSSGSPSARANRAPRKTLGSGEYPPVAEAPGSYVHAA